MKGRRSDETSDVRSREFSQLLLLPWLWSPIMDLSSIRRLGGQEPNLLVQLAMFERLSSVRATGFMVWRLGGARADA